LFNQSLIAADCSFVPNIGKHTDELGTFYNSVRGKAEKSLEISMLTCSNAKTDSIHSVAEKLSRLS